jgi:hypothetical protein
VHKVKSHKTVEQIAKKHRLDVSFVKKQLEMGIPIEHEHTKDKDLATDIALQHLDEIPDYYTRLKKMEASAKKSHKKYKDVVEELDQKSAKDPGYSLRDWFKGGGWVQTGGKYDGKPCAKQPGQTTKPFCRDPDDRSAMSKKERNRRAAKKRKEDPNPNRTGAAKIVTKEQYIQEKKGEKDACYNKVKSRYKIWPSAYASGALTKCRKVGADNWGTKSEDCWDGYEQKGMKKKGKKTVPNCVPIKEGMGGIRYCPKCQKDETRDECRYGQKYWDLFSVPPSLSSGNHYDTNSPHPGNFPESYDHEHSMARSEISTIISAAKRLKKKMKGEGNIEAWVQSKITKAADYLDSAADYVDSGEMKEESESLILQDLNGNDFVEIIDVIKPLPIRVKKEQFSNWREELKQELTEDGEQLDELWGKVALAAGTAALPYLMKKIGEKPVNDAIDKARKTSPIGGEKRIPQMNSYKPEGDVLEDWQSVNRKDKTDGLSKAAVNAYRRENPGSKLQTAVTEKNPQGKRADRRSNFCSRMSGMKDKLTSAKTARDPDSRINKALRRWRCN